MNARRLLAPGFIRQFFPNDICTWKHETGSLIDHQVAPQVVASERPEAMAFFSRQRRRNSGMKGELGIVCRRRSLLTLEGRDLIGATSCPSITKKRANVWHLSFICRSQFRSAAFLDRTSFVLHVTLCGVSEILKKDLSSATTCSHEFLKRSESVHLMLVGHRS